MAITKKDTDIIWQLITTAQYAAWLEGHKAGDEGAERTRNPYPRPTNKELTGELYLLMRGLANGNARK